MDHFPRDRGENKNSLKPPLKSVTTTTKNQQTRLPKPQRKKIIQLLCVCIFLPGTRTKRRFPKAVSEAMDSCSNHFKRICTLYEIAKDSVETLRCHGEYSKKSYSPVKGEIVRNCWYDIKYPVYTYYPSLSLSSKYVDIYVQIYIRMHSIRIYIYYRYIKHIIHTYILWILIIQYICILIDGRLNINIHKYFCNQQKTLKQKGGWDVFPLTASYLFGDIVTLQLLSWSL